MSGVFGVIRMVVVEPLEACECMVPHIDDESWVDASDGHLHKELNPLTKLLMECSYMECSNGGGSEQERACSYCRSSNVSTLRNRNVRSNSQCIAPD